MRTHLGNGVYADCEDWPLELLTENYEGDNIIYMDKEIWEKLKEYMKKAEEK